MSEPLDGRRGQGVQAVSVAERAASSQGDARPRYSIVIPIHNEADCLTDEVAELVGELQAREIEYELLLAENGSSDECPVIADALVLENPRIRVLHVPVPAEACRIRVPYFTGRVPAPARHDADAPDACAVVRLRRATLEHEATTLRAGSR